MPGKKITPPVKETRDVPVSLRLRPSLHKALIAAAIADRRSVSQMIEIELEEAMKAKGYLR
jgi:hypothetical protein